MPNPIRQKNIAAKPTNILNRIKPLQAMVMGVSMALYGRSGTGKTRFAATWPKPLLLIGAEDGTRSICTDKGIEFVRLLETLEMVELLNYLKTSEKFKSVVLDTGTMLQDLILKELCGFDTLPEQKGWGLISRDQYMQTAAQCKEYLRQLLDLKYKGINVCIICQERNFKEDDKDDILMPSVGSSLQPALAAWLHPACENVGQMYIRKQMTETSVHNKITKQTTKIRSPTGKVEYCLRTEENDVYASKYRVPRGKKLERAIVDPSWEKLWALIN